MYQTSRSWMRTDVRRPLRAGIGVPSGSVAPESSYVPSTSATSVGDHPDRLHGQLELALLEDAFVLFLEQLGDFVAAFGHLSVRLGLIAVDGPALRHGFHVVLVPGLHEVGVEVADLLLALDVLRGPAAQAECCGFRRERERSAHGEQQSKGNEDGSGSALVAHGRDFYALATECVNGGGPFFEGVLLA
jgi:hypothetical protein